MGGGRGGRAEGEGKGGSIGLSSRAEVREKGEGAGKGVVYAYEAYEAKKRGGKLLCNSHRRIFFKKKILL
jgi:hypothetical protein